MRKHFSATVYVVKKIDGTPRVLLHLHKKHNAWYGLGGHVEENEDPVEAVIREAKEEAGITVRLLSPKLHTFKYANELPAPITLMDQNIDNDHRHIDCIYVGVTDDKPAMNEPFKWFSEKELDSMDIQADTRYIAKEALIYFQKHGAA